ncbi:hypothetical protein WH47_03576 [Habropoda laboriosa]|uniref:Uncharacterized protein n=1 Tax=Habropoda laboriosa TaxID=597456 RepID=A0A0L7RI73_9HYME|nr:hypothetical protein WH47_03576 [Habropoda laboriosa]
MKKRAIAVRKRKLNENKYHVGPQILHVAVKEKIPRWFHPVACARARSLAVPYTETLHRLQGTLGTARHLREIHR